MLKVLLHVLTFEPRMEQRLIAGVEQQGDDSSLVIEPELTEALFRSLSQQVELMMSKRLTPTLICAPILRRQLYLFCERAVPQLQVLSLNEVSTNIHVRAFAMISEQKKVA